MPPDFSEVYRIKTLLQWVVLHFLRQPASDLQAWSKDASFLSLWKSSLLTNPPFRFEEYYYDQTKAAKCIIEIQQSIYQVPKKFHPTQLLHRDSLMNYSRWFTFCLLCICRSISKNSMLFLLSVTTSNAYLFWSLMSTDKHIRWYYILSLAYWSRFGQFVLSHCPFQ